MNDQRDIVFVDAHSKRIRRRDYIHFARNESVLDAIALSVGESEWSALVKISLPPFWASLRWRKILVEHDRYSTL